MFSKLVAGATLAIAIARPIKESENFSAWKVEFGLSGTIFEGTEEAFLANVEEAKAHNSNGKSTWTAGVNKFSGLTKAEFKAYIGRGYSKSGAAMAEVKKHAKPLDLSTHVPVEALPSSLDWRTKNPPVVTKVKDQGGCGGCWSFSAAETAESNVAINTGKLFVFSEQEILACTPNPDQCGGTGGCSGATQELAFAYIMSAGITTEAQWPYTMQSGTCNWAGKKPVANFTGWSELPVNNYTALMNQVNVQPIAISAAAGPWQSYDKGVFSCPNDGICDTDVDHAIVLEGYGTDPQKGDYYLVRNSWSAGWGEAGYIRVARYGSSSKGEPCAEDKTPGDGDGCKGGPSQIQVCGVTGILSDSSVVTGGYLL